jgi:hypothetical protein
MNKMLGGPVDQYNDLYSCAHHTYLNGDIHSDKFVMYQLRLAGLSKFGQPFTDDLFFNVIKSNFINEVQERDSMTIFERLYYDMKLKVNYTGKMSELLKTEKHDPNYTSMLLVKHQVNLQNVVNGEYSIFSRLRNIIIELGSFQLANGFNYQSNTLNSLLSIFTIGSFIGFDNIVSNFIYEHATIASISLLSIGSGIDFTLVNVSKVFSNMSCIITYLFTGSL